MIYLIPCLDKHQNVCVIHLIPCPVAHDTKRECVQLLFVLAFQKVPVVAHLTKTPSASNQCCANAFAYILAYSTPHSSCRAKHEQLHT